MLGLPGIGPTMRKSTARRRIATAGLTRCDRQRDAAHSAADLASFEAGRVAAERAGEHLPQPTEIEFPHLPGTSRACAYHPLWQDLERAVAKELDSLPFADARDLVRALRKHPRWREWLAAERAALEGWRGRVAARQAKALESTTRARSRQRQAAITRGEDLTAAEYQDTLRRHEGSLRTRRRR